MCVQGEVKFPKKKIIIICWYFIYLLIFPLEITGEFCIPGKTRTKELITDIVIITIMIMNMEIIVVIVVSITE